MAQPSAPKRAAGLAGFDAYSLALKVYRGILAVTRGRVPRRAGYRAGPEDENRAVGGGRMG